MVNTDIDSEHFFAVYIDELQQHKTYDVDTMAESLCLAIQRVVEYVRLYGDGEPCYLNVAISDGNSVRFVSRYTNAPNYAPESLYYFTGTLYEYAEKDDSDEFSVLVSSEKLSNQPDWVEVPENHIIRIQHGKMTTLWAI